MADTVSVSPGSLVDVVTCGLTGVQPTTLLNIPIITISVIKDRIFFISTFHETLYSAMIAWRSLFAYRSDHQCPNINNKSRTVIRVTISYVSRYTEETAYRLRTGIGSKPQTCPARCLKIILMLSVSILSLRPVSNLLQSGLAGRSR